MEGRKEKGLSMKDLKESKYCNIVKYWKQVAKKTLRSVQEMNKISDCLDEQSGVYNIVVRELRRELCECVLLLVRLSEPIFL